MTLKQKALVCAYRLQATGLWNSNSKDSAANHTLLWSLMAARDENVLAPSDMTRACSFPYITFSVNILPRQNGPLALSKGSWKNIVVCYTDGALLEGRVGAGVYCRE